MRTEKEGYYRSDETRRKQCRGSDTSAHTTVHPRVKSTNDGRTQGYSSLQLSPTSTTHPYWVQKGAILSAIFILGSPGTLAVDVLARALLRLAALDAYYLRKMRKKKDCAGMRAAASSRDSARDGSNAVLAGEAIRIPLPDLTAPLYTLYRGFLRVEI